MASVWCVGVGVWVCVYMCVNMGLHASLYVQQKHLSDAEKLSTYVHTYVMKTYIRTTKRQFLQYTLMYAHTSFVPRLSKVISAGVERTSFPPPALITLDGVGTRLCTYTPPHSHSSQPLAPY